MEKILPQWEAFRKTTRSREVDLYEVFCAILFFTTSKVVVRGGCCRVIFPTGETFLSPAEVGASRGLTGGQSLWEKLLAELVGEVRQQDGRDEHTSMIILDSLRFKHTDTAGDTGFAGGKNVNGIKRHVGVASLGLPHVIHVTTANVTDREATLERFRWPSDSLPAVKTVLADGSSTGENLATGVRDVLSARVDMANRAELHTLVVIPKRWVVERSFAWKDQVSSTLEKL